MPRSTIADRRAYTVDGELLLQATGTQTATHQGAAQLFRAGKTMQFKAVMAHGAFTGTVDGANNWSSQVEVSVDGATGWTALGDPLVTVNADGANVEKVYSGLEVQDTLANAEYIRINTTLNGAPGNITYTAFVTPC